MPKIYCKDCEHFDKCVRGYMPDCPVYYPKKGIMTNEEWLHTLNTEQLADVFFDYRYVNATPQQQLWLSANEDFVKGGIVEWLKQPHNSPK